MKKSLATKQAAMRARLDARRSTYTRKLNTLKARLRNAISDKNKDHVVRLRSAIAKLSRDRRTLDTERILRRIERGL